MKKEKAELIVYQCSYCGWMTSELQYYSYKFDYGCPHCKTSLYTFKRKTI